MSSNLVEYVEGLHIATEALNRYKLRTFLSVLGVILGVAAVIAMMSVSEGARRESLRQVETLGLDNLVVRSNRPSVLGAVASSLPVSDAARLSAIVPLVGTASPSNGDYCMQKVFGVKIDLDMLRMAERKRDGFGAVRAIRVPLPMCRSEIESCYENRTGELGCVNPEFKELPAGSPTFRVIARLR